jgi:hypothetical protein
MPTKRTPVRYRIRVKGHLGPQWSEWFDQMAIILEADGTTTLSGPIVDQAALHGLLVRVRDLGLELLSVSRDDPGRNPPDSDPVVSGE